MTRLEIARKRELRRVQARTVRPAVLDNSTPVYATGAIRRSRAVPLTATQRDSTGRRSDWSRSPEFFTDPKWGATVREVRA